MAFGVTPDGFSQKELEDVQTEIESDLQASFGPSINLQADSTFGQIIGVFSDKLAELWEVLTAVYRSQYPDSASDEALDNVSAITGAKRLAAARSQVTLDQIFLDGSTTLPAGRLVGVGPNGNRFRTLADVTNAAAFPVTVSVAAESEQTGPVVGFAEAIDSIITPFSGWNAKAALTASLPENYNLSGGETLTVKVDRGAAQTVNFVGGDFAVGGAATAAEVATRIATDLAGASAADAGGSPRITSDLDGSGSAIEVTGGTANAVLGFSTTEVKGFNTEDAALGRDIESDPGFRVRREQGLSVSGAGTVDAIRANVLAVTDVDEAFVFENVTDVTDGSGVPPKAFETVVRAPLVSDADIAQAIFDAKPAGILAHGAITEIVGDSQGFNHSIGFSRATEIDIYIDIDLTVNTDPDLGAIYPVDGDAQVAAVLASKGNSLGIGQDVISQAIKAEAFQVSGVIDITDFDIGTAPAPVGDANIAIANDEIAQFDTGDIVVNS